MSAIVVENLSKRYVIGHQTQADTLRDALGGGVRTLWNRLRRQRQTREEFYALRDVSFSVEPGEVVGIIGRNGAGKSTLLKILSRITEPTTGRIALNGRVASLLEVGTGFHPELSGRENIFLNGAILGMSRAEIRRKFDEIVAFSEVEKFLDTPVKRYSSGMYVRLAFAVAAHLEPEILIVDEVLAVGDIQFQKKCLGKIRDVAHSGGKTVLFVSHQMGSVRELCSRALLLEKGLLTQNDSSAAIVAAYIATNRNESHGFSRRLQRQGTGAVRIENATLLADGNPVTSLLPHQPIDLMLNLNVIRPVPVAVECILRGQDGTPIGFHAGGLVHGVDCQLQPNHYDYRCIIRPPELAAGLYTMDILVAESNRQFHEYLEHALTFSVISRPQPASNWSFTQSYGAGCFLLPGEIQRPSPSGPSA